MGIKLESLPLELQKKILLQLGIDDAKKSKYNAEKATLDNVKFDSRAEAKRYATLKLWERAGQISNLRLQPEYPFYVNDQKVFTYRADFSYTQNNSIIVEDVKGFKTPVYRLKKKIIEAFYGIQINEVK
jgi:hypothetical protein